MKSLSGLDATFLYFETPETPMHVGSLILCELPQGFRGSFHAAVRRHMAARMHLAPVFTRRLAPVPLGLGHPAWVEADAVDLAFHVRKVPGRRFTVAQVEATAARLHGLLIDRDRPLWEFHVFEDVEPPPGMGIDGRLAGFYSKIHHAALDGKGATVLANAVLDLGAVPRPVAADARRKTRPAEGPKVGEMIGAVFSHSLAQYVKLARSLPAVAASLRSSLARGSPGGTGKGGAGPGARPAFRLAPRTLFNVGITRERAFATATLPFAPCRALADAAGGTFNDLVLWLCSTALRNYLRGRSALPRRSLVAAMPVSLRAQGNEELNNQASITAVELGTQWADPLKRMDAIKASTGKVKRALGSLASVIPTDYPSLLAPWLVGGAARALFSTYGKSGIAAHLPAIANVAISNVPGPQAPLYLAGARILAFHPLSIVLHGLALNITIQTYAGSVDFGIVGDKVAVPDARELAAAIEAAFQEAAGVFVQPRRRSGRSLGRRL